MLNQKKRITISLLRDVDIPTTTDIHCRAFPKSRSTSLGRPYVRKMFKWFLMNQPQLCLVARENQSVVGYVIGSNGGYGRLLFRYAFPEILLGLLTHPRIWLQPQTFALWQSYLQGLKPRTRKSRSESQPGSEKVVVAALAGIGVDPEKQGIGIGEALVMAFENSAREKMVKRLSLSVKLDNAAARRLYEKCGWKKDFEDPHQNSAHYTKTLDYPT